MENNKQRPFLKWLGNKYPILSELLPHFSNKTRLIEPFVGSGAVFLNTNFHQYLLNDSNPDLIILYQTIQARLESFIDAAQRYFVPSYNTPEQYYQLRDCFNHTQNPMERACLFLYLNKHGFSGLCRYNRQGKFNVPFGFYKKNPGFPEPAIRAFAVQAKKAKFVCGDYKTAMLKARPGDIIYCDPPYADLNTSTTFTLYHARPFNQQAQLELADLAQAMALKGIPVIISNHAVPLIRKAYKKARLHTFKVPRIVGRQQLKRIVAPELIAVFA